MASKKTLADSIPSRLFKRADEFPTAHAFGVKKDGTWNMISWLQYAAEVRLAGRAMIHLGLKQGQAVGILGFNTYEWVAFHVASMCVGAAGAGIYSTSSATEVQYIVHHTESPIVLVENKKQYEKIASQRHLLPHLRTIVLMRNSEVIHDPMTLTWDAFIALASNTPERLFDMRMEAIRPEHLATFIYTSGTTGPPKGVMLSHRTLAWTADAGCNAFKLTSADCSVSYLPLSHIAEQMFTVHAPITCGGLVYFAESIFKLPENLREIQPTSFFGVPRVWEKFMAKAQEKLDETRGIKGTLASWARVCARDANAATMAGKKLGWIQWAKHRLYSATVLSKIKHAMGLSRARMCGVGAAPIDKSVLEFFSELNIVIYEVYGMSEDCGPTSWNNPITGVKLGTAGRPVTGIDVKIAPEDHEILVKGPNVFMGYFKDPEATAETMTEDGYLRTGDIGEFDADGFLKITGRKKEILITAGGKNISPKNIELALKSQPLINEAVVVGDRMPYLTALITVDPDQLAAFCKENSITKPFESKQVREFLQAGIDAVNSTLAQVETIKKFTLLPNQFSLETGELTGTLKIKRRVVYVNYAKEIEAMYAGAGSAD
eukprot:TRINITY_DN4522_c0_g1_i1.p1 TRINITY_DN4522_c0_g1~~TRINITY_DN4522_c0_g1_i1.p1  ORF type:complete len:616 (+),score=134.54 TRINITY_DN4522_c0_g1_i1:39-1850(+)